MSVVCVCVCDTLNFFFLLLLLSSCRGTEHSSAYSVQRSCALEWEARSDQPRVPAWSAMGVGERSLGTTAHLGDVVAAGGRSIYIYTYIVPPWAHISRSWGDIYLIAVGLYVQCLL